MSSDGTSPVLVLLLAGELGLLIFGVAVPTVWWAARRARRWLRARRRDVPPLS